MTDSSNDSCLILLMDSNFPLIRLIREKREGGGIREKREGGGGPWNRK